MAAEEVQVVFVLPADYPRNLKTTIYFLEDAPSNDVWRDFDDFVRLNLVAGLSDTAQTRLIEGSSITVEDLANKRTYNEDAIAGIILPFVATFLFLFSTMSASGYMLRVVAGEKENRTMEIMITSMKPWQLVGGKAVGLLSATLTQLLIYIVTAVIAINIAAPYIPELQSFAVPWNYIAVMALFFIPAYSLVAAIMIAVGAAVTDIQQGQQIAGLLSLLFTFPLFLLPVIIENTDHALVTLFTLFPTTSFLTVSLRWGLGAVPMWQLALGWLISSVSALLMGWAAARIFRVGMLRYGQPLTLKSALSAIRSL